MSKKFSIIIPTMWKSELLLFMLQEYDRSEYVGEIIIIDNNPKERFNLSSFKKVVLHSKGENIFVNPAWNWGSQLAKHELILANDDITIEDVDKVLSLIVDSDYDIAGIRLKEVEGDMRIQNIKKFPSNNFGCFMYIKHYKQIPEELKIWYGDRIQFYFNQKRGWITNSKIKTHSSTTINSNKKYFRNTIGQNDRMVFRILKEKKAI